MRSDSLRQAALSAVLQPRHTPREEVEHGGCITSGVCSMAPRAWSGDSSEDEAQITGSDAVRRSDISFLSDSNS
ncbi:hypothetical protein AAFF_G00155080 [Aldrovandia affinis]|uniref:Uncharacterized protein n=1 Tax=Aldrovandia affinis TaxID=143900 RepID=A0AAD7WWR3_9TELE|nr:hypothetical protein AAFF_G00155080 [Aldrovandia affinis]